MKRPGFTLAEVLLSLFVLSSSMFILSELQVKSMIKVWHGREDIDRLYIIKKYLYKLFLEPKQARKQTRRIDEPAMKLTVDAHSFHKKSSLAPFRKRLQFASAVGEWERGTRKRQVRIVTLVPLPVNEKS